MEATSNKTTTSTQSTSAYLIRYNGNEVATATNSVVAHAAAAAQSMIVDGRVEMWCGLVLAYVYHGGDVVGRYY